MNEHERKEFEHHKKMAEQQLNQMYFGANKNPKTKSGLEMPSFLASPKQQPKSKETPISGSLKHADNTNPQKKDSKPQKSGFMGGSNLLKLLNFKDMNMDSDRLIILAVCLLLSGEDVDELLMLALFYIML